PVWIADQTLAFTRDVDSDHPKVYTASYDGANLRALPLPPRIAIGGSEHTVVVTSATRMNVVDLATGTERQVTREFPTEMQAPILSPNSKWLVFESGPESQNIHRMAFPNGKLEQLRTVPSGQTVDGVTIDDDGRVMVAVQRWSGDLHVVPAKPNAPF